MSAADYQALLPYLILAGGAVLLLLFISFERGHRGAVTFAVAVLAVSTAVLPLSLPALPRAVTPLVHLDGFTVLLFGLFAGAAIVTAVVSQPYLRGRRGEQAEYYVLLLCATLGAVTLTTAVHFATVLLGLEILSISLYAMIGYPEERHAPLEAALKYLVLSGVGSTSMLLGMALIYVATGSLEFSGIGEALATLRGSPYFVIGHGLFLLGAAFKISLVPLHMWTPDVYQGAPAPVTGFLATVAKGAVVAVTLRYLAATRALENPSLVLAIGVVAAASMIVGNLLALLQQNLKRVLAYSSIAHLGYLLIALMLVGTNGDLALGVEATLFYLAAYIPMTLLAFGVVSLCSLSFTDREADRVEDYEGLLWRRPAVAVAFTAALLSLAGIPLTLGFIAKFYLFAAGVSGTRWLLLWALIAGSGIGLFYYLRIIFAMTRRTPDAGTPYPRPGPRTLQGALGLLALILIGFGVYPAPLIDVVRRAVTAFGG